MGVIGEKLLRPVKNTVKTLTYKYDLFINKPVDERGVIVTYNFHRTLPDATPSGDWRRLLGHPTVSELREMFRYLRRHFEVIPLSRSLRMLAGGRPLDKNYAVLTVDDGYLDFRTNLLPLLEEMEIPVAFFICTGGVEGGALWFQRIYDLIETIRADRLVVPWRDATVPFDGVARRLDTVENDIIPHLDGLCRRDREGQMAALFDANGVTPGLSAADPFCTADDLRVLDRSPWVELYLHGHEHQNFLTMSEEEVEEDVGRCQAFFRRELGSDPRTISYPRGGFRPDQWSVLSSLGLEAALSVEGGCEWPGRSPMLGLRRMGLEVRPIPDIHWKLRRYIRGGAGTP